MKKIFWGFIFIFFDFNITIYSTVIGLIPEFLGYIFIIQGLSQLSFESNYFEKARPFGIVLEVYYIIYYILNLIGLAEYLVNVNLAFSLILMAVRLSLFIYIILGIRDIESNYKCNLNSTSLMVLTIIEIVLQFLSYICFIFVLNLDYESNILYAPIILCLIIHIVFLVMFKNLSNSYEQLRKYADYANSHKI